MTTVLLKNGTVSEIFSAMAYNEVPQCYDVFIYTDDEELKKAPCVIRNVYEDEENAILCCGKSENQQKFGIPYSTRMLCQQLNLFEKHKVIQIRAVHSSFTLRVRSLTIDKENKTIFLATSILTKMQL